MVKIVVHTDGNAMHRCTVDINHPPPELVEATRHALRDAIEAAKRTGQYGGTTPTGSSLFAQRTSEGDQIATELLKKVLERMAR